MKKLKYNSERSFLSMLSVEAPASIVAIDKCTVSIDSYRQ